MGRLRITAAECSYQELDRQLKEQFIHGLNDKDMLGEIIKELMASRSNNHITSGNVLTWVKRVEAQRTQADAMNNITEQKEFDKIKVSRTIHKESPKTPAQSSNQVWQACRYCGSFHQPRQCLGCGKVCMECNKTGHFWRVCRGKRERAVHEVEQEIIDNEASEEIEMSVHSVQVNVN